MLRCSSMLWFAALLCVVVFAALLCVVVRDGFNAAERCAAKWQPAREVSSCLRLYLASPRS